MIHVVGFEGRRDAESPVNWGAAALSDGEHLINAATKRRGAIADLQYLEEEGHLARLERPIKVPDAFAESPLVVAELKKTDLAYPLLGADTGKSGGLAAHGHTDAVQIYVFETNATFDAYCARVATSLMQSALYEERTSDQRQHLVRVGLLLASNHPALNALRVSMVPFGRRERAREVALRKIDEADQAMFETILWALTTLNSEYVIKYEGGVSEGGGLDLNEMEHIVRNTRATHQPFVSRMAKVYPFLRKPPEPRLRDLKGAASAHFHFVADVKGELFGERVARLLELRMLEDSLAGEMPVDLPDREKVEKAVGVIRAPSADTKASHVTFGRGELRLYVGESERKQESARRSEPLIMLGYQSGLIREADEVEIMLAPPSRRRGLMLRTTDNGDGEDPIGVRKMRQTGSDLLFAPACFTLMRVVQAGEERDTTYLREVQNLPIGKGRKLTAIPSSVLDGAIMYNFEIGIHRTSANTIATDIGRIDGVNDRTLVGARKWMESFATLCEEFEIDPPAQVLRRIRYWKPAKLPQATPLQRVLVVLRELGGRAHQSHLIAAIDERYGGNARTNNTRREVIRNPTLLAFADDDQRTITLLERGKKVAEAYIRAGGRSAAGRRSSER